MKFYIFMVLMILVSSAFGAKTSSQFHLSKGKGMLGNFLKKSSLGNGLLSLVHMFAKEKENGSAEDWQDLFDALDLLETTLQSKIEAENKDFSSDNEVHTKEAKRIASLILEYEGSLATLEFTEDQINKKHDLLQLELKNQEGQLKIAVAGRDKEEQFLDNAKQTFEAEFDDYQQAIDVLQQAIKKLEEAQESAIGAGFDSFLQENSMNFQGFSIMVEKHIKKLQNSQVLFMHPINSIFSALENQEKVEPTRIADAVKALQDLQIHFQKARVALKQAYDQDVTSHVKLLESLQAKVDQLKVTLIPGSEENIKTNREAFDLNDKSVQEIKFDIRTETGYLNEENESWAKRQEINDLLIPKLEGELKIVASAQKILESKRPAAQKKAKSTAPKKAAEKGAKDDAGDAKDAAGKAKDAAGDAKDAAGDAKDAAGDAKDAAGDAKDAAGDAKDAAGDAKDAAAGDAKDAGSQ